MTDREILIDLVMKSVDGYDRNWAETIVDYLIENNVGFKDHFRESRKWSRKEEAEKH